MLAVAVVAVVPFALVIVVPLFARVNADKGLTPLNNPLLPLLFAVLAGAVPTTVPLVNTPLLFAVPAPIFPLIVIEAAEMGDLNLPLPSCIALNPVPAAV